MLLALVLQHKAYFSDVRTLLVEMGEGKRRLVITLLNLVEVTKLLRRDKWSIGKIVEFMQGLLDLDGLVVVGVDSTRISDALQLCTKYDIDLVDAYTVLIIRANHIKVIYSLDSDYDKFKKEFTRLTEITAR